MEVSAVFFLLLYNFSFHAVGYQLGTRSCFYIESKVRDLKIFTFALMITCNGKYLTNS